MGRENTMTRPHPVEVTLADCEVMLGQRQLLLCHRHAQAIIDLADGNGVKLSIQALDSNQPQPCSACWAAAEVNQPVIILPD